jgi:hypothetical protein
VASLDPEAGDMLPVSGKNYTYPNFGSGQNNPHLLHLNLIASIDIVKLLPVKNEGEAITPLIIFQ